MLFLYISANRLKNISILPPIRPMELQSHPTELRHSSKMDSKMPKKRPALATITDNWQIKKQPVMKRSVSIANINRRLSLSSLSKKTEEIVNLLLKMPKKDKHLMTAQIKCFMMAKHKHDSHLMDQKLAMNAVDRMRNSDRVDPNLKFDKIKFILFCQNVLKKSGDSSVLAASFESCLTEQYPPSIHFMLIYMGVFFYSINSQYQLAESYCQKLFDLVVKYKLEEYFIIYLVLKIKLKTNLSEWEGALKLLSKLVFFSWMYSLVDLEIWCYFELSRAYFFLQMSKQSQIFRLKSQNNSTEPKRSIYREVCISNLILEIEAIWQGQLDFKYNTIIEQTRLIIPECNRYGVEDYIADQRKLKTNIKSIIQDCKIRHVSNLLTRIGEIGMHSMQKDGVIGHHQSGSNFNSSNCSPSRASQCPILLTKIKTNTSSKLSLGATTKQQNPWPNNPSSTKSGNNFLLTHKSFNKNMCMFFRKRATNEQSSQRIFYTIENSHKNWGVLREMLRNIYVEIVHVLQLSSKEKQKEKQK